MKEKTAKIKASMTLRFAAAMASASVIFFLISITAGYATGFLSIRGAAGANYQKMAYLLSSDLANLIESEIKILESATAADLSLARAIEEKKFRAYILKDRGEVAKACIISSSGAVVAAYGETSILDYGSEKWWQDSFGAGKGRAVVTAPELDSSLGIWCLPIIVPVRGSDAGIIGAARYMVSMASFFGLFEDFSFGNTGEAVLVDDKGYLVFHRQAKPYNYKFCGYEELRQMLKNDNRWFLITSAYLHRDWVVASFNKVRQPALSEGNINWWVCVLQDQKEVFAALNNFFLKVAWLALLLTIIAAAIGALTGARLTGPMRDLKEGMARVGRGDMDYRLKAESRDEAGEALTAFNDMLDNLKSTSTSVLRMNTEIEKREGEIKRLAQIRMGLVRSVTRLKSVISNAAVTMRTLLDNKFVPIGPAEKNVIETSLSDIEKLDQGIDNLLEVARIESGEMTINAVPVDVREVMRGLILSFEPKIRSKGLDFRLSMPRGKTEVMADPAKLKQILFALLDNACKFTGKGYVEVSIKELKDEVECSVMDTGIGIQKEDLPRVFDKAQETGAADKALGMSLFIASKIIEKLNGQIWAESEPGKWTKFTFKLPKKSA